MKSFKLGIVGASGLVGKKIIDVLIEENLIDKFELYLITSENNEGKTILIKNKKFKYLKLDDNILNLGFNIVFFSAGDNISKMWAEKFASNGAYIIDNSNAFRRNINIPLIIPEINEHLITKETKIIANPNCSTIQLAVVVDRIKKLSKIEKIIVSSYQSVSGAGKLALEDLKNDTKKYFNCDIKNNIIPQIGEIENNGFCTEENKIMFELNKILNDEIDVLATTVRVPVEYCHGESVYIKLVQKTDINSVKSVLKCNFIELSENFYQNKDCIDKNNTFVCRLRQVSDYEYLFVIFADNLRRGAAYNAVLILKKVMSILKN